MGYTVSERTPLIFAGLVIFLYFFAGAGNGLRGYFTTDDLVNMSGAEGQSAGSLIGASLLYFSPSYRPLGGLFYHLWFAGFRLNPFPFRLMCFLLLIANLFLAWVLAHRVTGSAGIAAISTLLGAFHPRFADLYWNTGTIYDILCFTFYYLALVVYLGIRRRCRLPAPAESVLLLAIVICALDAKEMAVALPPVLLLGELILFPASLRGPRAWLKWITGNARLPLIAGLLIPPYIVGKLSSGSPFPELDRYVPHLSVHQFLRTYGAYLDAILYRNGWFSEARTAIALIALLLAAVCLRSRPLLFAWCLAVVGALPVAFIPPREAFAFYIPMAGWTLYAAVLIAGIASAVAPWPAPRYRSLAAFLLVLCLLLRAHRIQRHRMGGPAILGQQTVRTVKLELDRIGVKLPRGARVLTIGDPFGGPHSLLFLLRLYARDQTLELDQAGAADSTHDLVLEWSGTRLITLPAVAGR